MTVFRGFAITILSGLGFASVGAIAGHLIGQHAPDYYRTVFRIPASERPDLKQLGVILGTTQGFVLGAVIGLVITVSVAYCTSRSTSGPAEA